MENRKQERKHCGQNVLTEKIHVITIKTENVGNTP